MPRRINIFLVRHGLSEANLDRRVNMNLPDQAVPLTPEGHDQALEAGQALASALGREDRFKGRTRIMSSPYRRTRETASAIRQVLDNAGIFHDYREEIALREISFGLFDGYDDDELREHFPTEYAHYQKHLEMEVKVGDRISRPGEFWARMPMGESRAEVADRVKGVFGTILRDNDDGRDDPIRNFIIVSHGVTIRAFRTQWCHHTFETYGTYENPNNCEILLISSTGQHVYREIPFFDGFEHERNATQDRREDGKIS